MAEQHLTFKIGSAFSGEGFKQAQNAVKTVNQNVQKANAIFGQLSGALGSMDTSMSKALGAMSGMIDAFATMNPTVIITQAAMMVFNWKVREAQEEIERLTKKANAMRVAVEQMFKSKLTQSVADVTAEIKSLDEQFTRVTRRANDFAAALEGVRNAEAKGGALALKTEELQALLDAHSEEERQQIQATYALREATLNRANVEAENQAKLDAANQAVIDAQNRMVVLDKEVAAAKAKKLELVDVLNTLDATDFERRRAFNKTIAELDAKVADLEQKKIDQETEIDLLREKEKIVKQNAANAEEAATQAVMAVELANKKQEEALLERTTKEREAADAAADAKAAAELEKAAAEELAARKEEAAKLQQQINESSAKLAKAQDEYAEALKNYNDNLATNLISEAMSKAFSGQMKAGLLPVDVQKGISLQVADHKVDEAIRGGVVNTVKDADKLQREVMRQTRDKMNENSGQRAREAARYQRLQQQFGNDLQKMAAADREFYQTYKKIDEAQKQQKLAVEKAAKDVEEQKECLKKISEKMEKMGAA